VRVPADQLEYDMRSREGYTDVSLR
jgi:hypothetical protein